ncbi:uncharacterized protein RHIMIDRAFT_264077 [Rhizopus microsporus ATCC 52813]|uniref:Uncharacterized protein n=1 Tax=Rhizopus microsporus ATCC 52813 TaxID=1340429 RepID=A0A2G4SL71_RHIZD|nr:uncharacterized protein RHIMIDRAFT_264077 [Rhizopus microsporus ATCC 52813]PHZ09136.1 hypothetical protein RHIMIDRAFT_264077 [Rhizopus microsporus ATCC 52813]
MANVSRYTRYFEKKSPLSFTKWCHKHKLVLTEADERRKKLKENSGSKLTYYTLYVLNKEFMGKIYVAVKWRMHLHLLFYRSRLFKHRQISP